MSDSDRLKRPAARIALFGIVALFAVSAAVGAVVYGLWQQSEYERKAYERYREYAAHTYYPKRDTCLKLTFLSQKDCIANAEKEAREYERGEQDLVAQRVTAIWTSLMGTAAIVGMLLSVVGIYLVWTTFRATKEGNIITRDNGRAQVRAYIVCKAATFEATREDVLVNLTLANVGQSPARGIEVFGTLLIGRLIPVRNDAKIAGYIESQVDEHTFQPINAGGEITEDLIFGLVGSFEFEDEEAKERGYSLFMGGNALTFALRVKWLDVFGDSQEFPLTLSSIRLIPPRIGKRKVVRGKLELYVNDQHRDYPWP